MTQINFEVASIPFERVLSNDIQASNDFGGTSKEKHSKSISARSSCPSFSFNLTDMVNMWNGEDDVVGCAEQSDETIGGYKLKPEYMPILRAILSKYGDICRNCTLTMKHLSVLLEMICEIISELREKDLVKIKEDDLKNMIDLVNDIKNMEVDIEWLHQRLVKLLEARQVVDQSAAMKEGKEINKKFIEIAERRLEECEKKKKELGAQLRSLCDKETETKERLARALDESTKIKEAIKQAKDKVRCFLRHSMADGLI
ncbi:uncharacterized protein LOC130713389 [Lotus japonicus]|uniref:uncharacterized protein LOC130713389 n=1 Tax=Lotus japonicus TaxID=34305 RepID=UPI002588E6CD|nr:uncharacterized protein LOC130713389 [Lotus japonicus]